MHGHPWGHRACSPIGLGRGSGHFGRGFRAGPRGPGGPRRRMFDQGDLRLVILQLISEKPRYGYDIIKAIEEKLSGLYSPSPGVVYPTLTFLEEAGYATAATEGNKKVYAITDSGLTYLNENRDTVETILNGIEKFGQKMA